MFVISPTANDVHSCVCLCGVSVCVSVCVCLCDIVSYRVVVTTVMYDSQKLYRLLVYGF